MYTCCIESYREAIGILTSLTTTPANVEDVLMACKPANEMYSPDELRATLKSFFDVNNYVTLIVPPFHRMYHHHIHILPLCTQFCV
jgi:hypothetical protein